MSSHRYFKTCGLFLVLFTIVVQSVPIKNKDNTVQAPSIDNNKPAVNAHVQKFIDLVKSTSISTTTKPTDIVSQSSLSPAKTEEQRTDNKKKRFIEDDDGIDDEIDSDNDSNELNSFELPYFKHNDIEDSFDEKLHAKMQETKAKIHDNTDKTPDTDDSKVFSDIKMSPSELTSIVRRRRSIQLQDALNSRRKRALSPYDFYDTPSFYDSYENPLEYERYSRAFAPLYWYPSTYERQTRSSPSSNYPIIYTPVDVDENPLPMYEDDDDSDDESENEVNQYPVLVEIPNDRADDLPSLEEYNTDDLPIVGNIEEILNGSDNDKDDDADDDDDDGDDGDDEVPFSLIYQGKRPRFTRYEPLETYF